MTTSADWSKEAPPLDALKEQEHRHTMERTAHESDLWLKRLQTYGAFIVLGCVLVFCMSASYLAADPEIRRLAFGGTISLCTSVLGYMAGKSKSA